MDLPWNDFLLVFAVHLGQLLLHAFLAQSVEFRELLRTELVQLLPELIPSEFLLQRGQGFLLL